MSEVYDNLTRTAGDGAVTAPVQAPSDQGFIQYASARRLERVEEQRALVELVLRGPVAPDAGGGSNSSLGGSLFSGEMLRVLIAEDDALTSAMLRSILEQLGHQVVHAGDGRRALELAEFCQFDVIVLDGGMPQLSGAEAAGEIRALAAAARGAPIVALIGDAAEEAESCVAAGVNGILRRPVTVAGVARAIAAATDRKESAARAEARPALRVAI